MGGIHETVKKKLIPLWRPAGPEDRSGGRSGARSAERRPERRSSGPAGLHRGINFFFSSIMITTHGIKFFVPKYS